MKKIVFLSLAILLIMTGCNSSNKLKKELKDSGYSDNTIGKTTFICDEAKNVKMADNAYFITNDNRIYKYNIEQLFSNNKNCIEISNKDNYDLKLIYNRVIFDKNSEPAYKIEYDGKLVNNEEYKETSDENSSIANYLKWISDDYKKIDFIGEVDCSDGKVAFIIGNKVYVSSEFDEETKMVFEVPSDEKILLFTGELIKTDKSIYTLEPTNYEECTKYADVK